MLKFCAVCKGPFDARRNEIGCSPKCRVEVRRAYRKAIHQQRRRKYHADPAYRAALLARAKKYRDSHQGDPAYRAMRVAQRQRYKARQGDRP